MSVKDLKRLFTSRDSNFFFLWDTSPFIGWKISPGYTKIFNIFSISQGSLFEWKISIQVPCMTNFQSISSLFRDNQSHGEFPCQLPLSPASNVITVPGFMFCNVVVSFREPSVAHLGCLSSVSRTAGCQQQKLRFSSIELPSRSHFTVV